MANAVNNVSQVQQAAQVQAQVQLQAVKLAEKPAAAPQDTVNISAAGKAASQAQAVSKNAQSSGDVDHDGDNK